MPFAEYRKKRDFRRTPEPTGKAARSRKTLRYVIHKHAATRLHYDLRLELDGVLRSWAVPKGPSLDPSQKRLAVEVEDHPLEYGTFEGVIPKGEYGGGPVIVWDRGPWTPRSDPRAGLAKGHLSFELRGEKLQGGWDVIRMDRKSDQKGKTPWLLVKSKDEFARRGRAAEITESRPESVASGRNIEDLTGPPRGRARKRRSRSAAAVDPSDLPGAVRSKLPDWIAPQLATLVTEAPMDDGWLHELKYDGYRLLCRIEDGKARLLTRSGQDWTDRFRSIARAVVDLTVRQAMLDGEVVVLEQDGTSSFQALQNALSRGGEDLTYYVFDLIHLDGYDLRRVPLERRKGALAELLAGRPGDDAVRYSDHVIGQGDRFHAEACRRKLEGVVSKRREGHYATGRTRDWLKIKCAARQELVIGGFTEPQGSRHGFGALLLGVRGKDGGLRYSGRVGTGFTSELLSNLRRRLDRLETRERPFANPPRKTKDVHWVKPELVAEVSFTGWTNDGILRHPSFQGLREDKPAREVVAEKPVRLGASRGRRAGPDREPIHPERRPPVREPDEKPPAKEPPDQRSPVREPGRKRPAKEPPPPDQAPAREPPEVESKRARALAISHPDKVLYPEQGITKLDVARYMLAVSEFMLPQVAERPLMLLRCPEGVGRDCFFQKHPPRAAPEGLRRVEVRESGGRTFYLAVVGAAGLVALIQMGALEIHLWGSRADKIEQPDRVVFDLDPDPSVPWKDVVAAAHDVHDRLNDLGLDSFVKTTGGKGLHVVAPIRRGPGWKEIQEFTTGVAAGFVREQPDRWTAHLAKAKRVGKIFIDTLRNREARPGSRPIRRAPELALRSRYRSAGPS